VISFHCIFILVHSGLDFELGNEQHHLSRVLVYIDLRFLQDTDATHFVNDMAESVVAIEHDLKAGEFHQALVNGFENLQTGQYMLKHEFARPFWRIA
jgi:hypothetical protein